MDSEKFVLESICFERLLILSSLSQTDLSHSPRSIFSKPVRLRLRVAKKRDMEAGSSSSSCCQIKRYGNGINLD